MDWCDLDGDMPIASLDEDTIERMLAGQVSPLDAPPGYAPVATLLHRLSQVTPVTRDETTTAASATHTDDHGSNDAAGSDAPPVGASRRRCLRDPHDRDKRSRTCRRCATADPRHLIILAGSPRTNRHSPPATRSAHACPDEARAELRPAEIRNDQAAEVRGPLANRLACAINRSYRLRSAGRCRATHLGPERPA